MSASPRAPAAVPPDDPLERLLARFMSHLAAERRASRHTVLAYGSDLRALMTYARTRSSRSRVEDIDKLLLRSWLAELARAVTPTTLSRKLASVRAFFGWLERETLVAKNPASMLSSPKLRRKLPRFVGASAAAEIMEAPAAAAISEVERARDTALLEVLYGSGLRVSELVGLDRSHVTLEEGSLRVVGKG
jgi:integrase/recombinase XerC